MTEGDTIPAISLWTLEPSENPLVKTWSQGLFEDIFKEFLKRDDCQLVFELDAETPGVGIIRTGNGWKFKSSMVEEAKIRMMSLLKLEGSKKQSHVLSGGSEKFEDILREFLERGDCQLVLVLNNRSHEATTEASIARTDAGWEFKSRKELEPSILYV